MTFRPAAPAMAIAFAVTVAVIFGVTPSACTSGSGGGPGAAGSGGNAAGSSGTGNGGSIGACINGTPCGGSPVGTWNVTSSCLTLTSGNLDISNAGLDPTSCKNVTLTGSLTVTGTWTANANGTYTDGTTTSGTAQLALPAGCLMISGTTTTCARVGVPSV